jgi:nucleoid DNA-binding protein
LSDVVAVQEGWKMTKKEMAKAIADRMGLTQAQVQEIIQSVLDGIIETLATEGRIELRNFGVFEIRKRKPRIGRNPRTGEKVMFRKELASDSRRAGRWRSGSGN